MASKSLTFDLFGRDRTASKALKGVGGSVDGLSGKFKALGIGIAAAFVARAAIDFGKASVTAALEAEQAQTKLLDAFARFPDLADTNIDSLRAMNKQIMLKTGFDDDALATAQASLAQYKLTGSQIKLLTPLVADYARKTGRDLPDAAETLGKALLGQGRGLKEIGIQFKDTGSVAGNLEQLMTGLGEKVGGYAEQFGTTDAGRIEILKARFDEIKESVGTALLGAFDKIPPETVDKLVGKIEEIAPALGDVASGATDLVVDWVTGFQEIQDASFDFGFELGNLRDDLIADDYGTNGIWFEFGYFLGEARMNLEAFGGELWHFFNDLGHLDWGAFWGGFGIGIQTGAVTALNFLIGVVNNFLGTINLVIDGINKITGTNWSKLKIPTIALPAAASRVGTTKYQLAEGGIVRATPGGVSATIGEGGTNEAVVPLTRSNLEAIGAGIPGGGGMVVNVNVNGVYAGDKNALAKTVTEALRSAVKTGAIPAGYALA